MLYGILFVFGLIVGSFLNVVALRYDGERLVGDPKVIGGRSRCPHCGKTLQWYELIPVVSFIIQGRKCRGCGAKIGWQYPVVELLSACIFAFVPFRVMGLTGAGGTPFTVLSVIWVFAFEILLLISYIDLRLGIIPDELEVLFGVLAVFAIIFLAGYFGPNNHSLLGAYASPFGWQDNIWINHIVAAVLACGFFLLLIGVTRGKGMGLGDAKLAIPLGLFFGWPDVLFLTVLAFVIGALAGVVMIIAHRRKMKGSLPFAPFLALGATLVFFAGYPLLQWYWHFL